MAKALGEEHYLNSIKVRLEQKERLRVIPDISRFQFHKGMIRTRLPRFGSL